MGEQVGPDPARGPALALLTRARVAQELGWRVTGVHSSGRVLGGGATAPGWKRPAVPARVRPSPATTGIRAGAAPSEPKAAPSRAMLDVITSTMLQGSEEA